MQAKKASKEVQMSGIPFQLPNMIGYIRMVCLFVSWKYALTDPYTFTGLFTFSYLLDAVDGVVARFMN